MFNDLASRIGGYRLSEWGASVLSAALFFFIPSVLYGQGTTGTRFGTVLDKSGAVIAEAVVMATNTETGLKRKTSTNASGQPKRTLFRQSVLPYEGPGQGRALRKYGLTYTAEWEKPVTAMLDEFLHTHAKPSKIVLIGMSMGGFFAPRVAGKHKRQL
jgi:hypothetical protein